MQLSEIMQKEIGKTDADISITEAAAKMTNDDIGYLLVVNNSKLSGIITEDDIIKKVVSKGKDPHKTKVSDIMVNDVIHTTPERSLEEGAQIMTENNIKKLPIVQGKNLLGIVTASDIIAAEPKMMEKLGELVIFAKKQKRVAG